MRPGRLLLQRHRRSSARLCASSTPAAGPRHAAEPPAPSAASPAAARPRSFTIVGAGFAGLAVAYELVTQRSGPTHLALVDAKGLGGGASGVAAGTLHPFAPRSGKLVWRGVDGCAATARLLGAAQAALDAAAAAACGGGGGGGPAPAVAHWAGTLHAGGHPPPADAALGVVRWGAGEAAAALPGLRLPTAPASSPAAPPDATFYVAGASVHPGAYLRGLWAAVRAEAAARGGAASLTVASVPSAAELAAARAGADDALVLCTGAASALLPELAGLSLELVSGTVLTLDLGGPEEESDGSCEGESDASAERNREGGGGGGGVAQRGPLPASAPAVSASACLFSPGPGGATLAVGGGPGLRGRGCGAAAAMALTAARLPLDDPRVAHDAAVLAAAAAALLPHRAPGWGLSPGGGGGGAGAGEEEGAAGGCAAAAAAAARARHSAAWGVRAITPRTRMGALPYAGRLRLPQAQAQPGGAGGCVDDGSSSAAAAAPPPSPPSTPPVWLLVGLGSRGLVHHALMGAALARDILAELEPESSGGATPAGSAPPALPPGVEPRWAEDGAGAG